ncbi:hypothetical protein [Pseudomonas sp. 8 R 14]|uniref:hypothetical protein n=1 Tax=Pseudomonas sp. 8 R 14 TaxID=1844092 RepID=UPI0008128C09|nr:hypothetical protein [Pseudomonas sp. 8 R 14]CRM23895.1 hypothetical protein [Pseudomonas sp. 8 R 14]
MAADVVSTVVSSSIYTDMTFYLSVTAAMVSIATFVVGYTQMRIASAKVRLELYNKRFNIFLSALEYYQAVWEKGDGSINIKSAEFVKCYRESQFLFSDKDGVYDTLTKIMSFGSALENNREIREVDPISNHSNPIPLRDKGYDARDRMGEELKKLEKQMAKYIDFKVVRGWGIF